MDNKINFLIPDEVIVDVTSKLSDIVKQLKPYLIALTPTERQELPKMGDGTLPFVQNAWVIANRTLNLPRHLSISKVYLPT